MDPSTMNVDAAMQTAKTVAMITQVVSLLLGLLTIAGMWKTFSKAGKPGFASIIPIWNTIVILEIAQKPIWWIVMILLVPIANIIFAIMALAGMCKNFGKGAGYVVGMIFLPFIFFPMLGFGSAEYQPEGAEVAE